jgi:surface antigen
MFIVENTHDPADTKDHPNNTRWREENARIHLANAKKWTDDGLPVFMTGDFNSGYVARPDIDVLNGSVIPRDQLPYCILTDGGVLRDSYDAWKGNSGKCPTTNLSGRIIDHVYVSTDIKVNNSTIDTSQKNKGDTDHPVAIADALIPGASPVGTTKMSNDYANECRAMQARNPGIACDGECVDFVKFRLSKLANKHFGRLGNGGQVVNTLGGAGYTVNNSPAVNSVVSWPPGGVPGSGADDTYGHVAWVSQVNADGSIVVEEYNYLVSHGYDKRTIPKSVVSKLRYAHVEKDVR